jgi:hypothetical protein
LGTKGKEENPRRPRKKSRQSSNLRNFRKRSLQTLWGYEGRKISNVKERKYSKDIQDVVKISIIKKRELLTSEGLYRTGRIEPPRQQQNSLSIVFVRVAG